jgi:hypothetical protein
MVSLEITRGMVLPHLSWGILILASKGCVGKKKVIDNSEVALASQIENYAKLYFLRPHPNSCEILASF